MWVGCVGWVVWVGCGLGGSGCVCLVWVGWVVSVGCRSGRLGGVGGVGGSGAVLAAAMSSP